MTTHVILIFFSITIIEIINFYKFFNKFNICILLIKKISKVILSKKISDHWKEKTLLHYSKQIMINSLIILGILISIIFIYFVIIYFHHSFSKYFLSIIGILETTIIIIVYLFLKRFIYAKL